MGKKIFVSYKYADKLVCELPNIGSTTVRDYVDILQSKLEDEDHINKGEDDGEDMSSLADSTIGSKLGDKIFDSTVTIVMISKGMKDSSLLEKEQWIPWEVSYSLRDQSRNNQNSKINAVLVVVLPDENNLYDYYITKNTECDSRTLKIDFLFKILADNMFNKINPETRECNGNTIYSGVSSYIISVKWDDFINNMGHYVEKSLENWRNRNDFDIKKNLN